MALYVWNAWIKFESSTWKSVWSKAYGYAVRKLAQKHLYENTVVDGGMMIEMRTGEVLGPEIDYNHKF